MTTNIYIPRNAQLRAEQIESWAYQAAITSHGDTSKAIASHYSANAILNHVDETEKPALIAAWDRGYKNGHSSRS